MASFSSQLFSLAFSLAFIFFSCTTTYAQLSASFYATSCPTLLSIVNTTMNQAIDNQPRASASVLRLFFHDCFVNGCDASVLLDDTATFTGEKNAGPNRNSAIGFGVIDTIKARVEAVCNATVSCADILALAARDGVVRRGGTTWTVPLGRRDARTASQSAANSNLPGPGSSLSALISAFANQGLNAREMTVLSGAHTLGQAQCISFRNRAYNDANINLAFATQLQDRCPRSGGDANLTPLDPTQFVFNNDYYSNLLIRRGLLHSDQELFNNGTQDSLSRGYASNNALFLRDFAAAMIKMGNISPLTGSNGEIRRNCRVVN